MTESRYPGPAGPLARPRWGRLLSAGRRILPPVRLVWISLAMLGLYSTEYLRGVGLAGLILVPAVSVVADLAFQRARFPSIRFPDAALATGLFVALILPPVAPLAALIGVGFAAVSARHLLRWKGRPLLNPAASAVVLASFAFGLNPAWWAGVGPYGLYLTVALGLLIAFRAPAAGRFAGVFLIAYLSLTVLQHSLFGGAISGQIVLLEIADPTLVFFALFMVPEPRSAPAEPRSQVVYAGLVGIVAAFGPLWTPSLSLPVALVCGNLVGLALRRPASVPTSAARRPVAGGGRARRVPDVPKRAPARWTVGHRALAGLLVVTVLVAMSAAVPSEPSSLPGGAFGGGGSGGVTLTNCSKDNPAIPASTAATLHRMLGPSVLLSYNSGSGVVTFYDPVHQVTVTETDLYEDYGYAEFNGDDYAVSGCVP